ncbi:hypothetical protein Gasu2_18160 [Galdieria sulphuraria]|nr:hypothetical protein Gasu2_18160 [Galdieria sulphuraria]
MNFSYDKLEQWDQEEKVAKVLSEALESQKSVSDKKVKEFYEELFIATLEGAPVAYVSDSNVAVREYSFLVTTCALFSAVWYTTRYQFGCLLFVWKVGNFNPYYRIERAFHLIARALTFFFSPNISQSTWLREHSSVFYIIKEHAAFHFSIKELLYGRRFVHPSYLMGAIRCMPSPYPEGRSLLSDSLKPLTAKGALHVVLFHDPSKRFIAACRQKGVVPLSIDELELFILLSWVAQERLLDICGYIQLERSYQLVSIIFDYVKDISVGHDWLLLFVVKRKDYNPLMNAWSLYKERWIQQLRTRQILKDVDGFLQNPLSCKIISDHLKTPFPVHVIFYYRGLQLLVDTFASSNLFEKEIYDVGILWTKERVTEIIVHKERGHTWLCQSIGDNPPVNVVVFLQFELNEEHYGQLVSRIQSWFHRKQMSLFPLDWMEYFQRKGKWNIGHWL